MEKYIIELSSSGGDDFYQSEQYSIETDMTVTDIYLKIIEKSNLIEEAYRKTQNTKVPKNNKIVYFKPIKEAKELTDVNGNWNNKFIDICVIQFEVGSVVVPVNLEREEVLILTLDDWFKYCMRE